MTPPAQPRAAQPKRGLSSPQPEPVSVQAHLPQGPAQCQDNPLALCTAGRPVPMRDSQHHPVDLSRTPRITLHEQRQRNWLPTRPASHHATCACMYRRCMHAGAVHHLRGETGEGVGHPGCIRCRRVPCVQGARLWPHDQGDQQGARPDGQHEKGDQQGGARPQAHPAGPAAGAPPHTGPSNCSPPCCAARHVVRCAQHGSYRATAASQHSTSPGFLCPGCGRSPAGKIRPFGGGPCP